MFEDEASFWLDGTLHRTWSRVGVQPRVDTYGQRKTAHVFGAVSLDEAAFAYEFADVFNGDTFWKFLMHLVARFAPRKVLLIIDNAPYHWLAEDGKAWLRRNRRKLELHRLPGVQSDGAYMEGDAEENDPQSVLCDDAGARWGVEEDLQQLPASTKDHRSSCRHVQVIGFEQQRIKR